MRKLTLLLLTILMQAMTVRAIDLNNLHFHPLLVEDGLSNNQVNAIYKDSHGFVWFGTQSGLDRFDGFRFRNYFFDNNNPTSLPNNSVDEIMEDGDGTLWLRTSVGYCTYDHLTETFDPKPEAKLTKQGMAQRPTKLFIDRQKGMWIFVSGTGLYYRAPKAERFVLYPMAGKAARRIPKGEICDIAQDGNNIVITYSGGLIVGLDVQRQRVAWQNDYVRNYYKGNNDEFHVFVDSKGSYWISSSTHYTMVYFRMGKQWFNNAADFMQHLGYTLSYGHVLLKQMCEDRQGRLWMATDHTGLIIYDPASRTFYNYSDNIPLSVPFRANTIQSVYVDDQQNVWLGTYKNGVLAYTSTSSRFSTIPLGDVCSIAQDQQGVLWCGTNESGIVSYNLQTGEQHTYDRTVTGLGTDVVVSSYCDRKGGLWFGAYNGGLVWYHDGRWDVFRKGSSFLANDNVWGICGDNLGRIYLGLLGGGLQVYVPWNGRYHTFTMANSGLTSNYLNSVKLMPDGRILIGHSMGYSIYDQNTDRITSYDRGKDGTPFPSPSTNMAFMDSRGLVWLASATSLSFYDPRTGQQKNIDSRDPNHGLVGCAISEDQYHQIWIVSDQRVGKVQMTRNDKTGEWDYSTISYNYLDGLQKGQFNYRSICRLADNRIAVGGQEGINIITPQPLKQGRRDVHAVFAGLRLFDELLSAGEEYKGHVILDRALDLSKELSLRHDENTFTILLASSRVTVPNRSRFLYRLRGSSDDWIMTPPEQPAITFANLTPGKYHLDVKVVDADGTVNDRISTLTILVKHPWYATPLAYLIYIILIVAVALYYRYRFLRRQKELFRIKQMEVEQENRRKLDEARTNFFTNVSHELRTPLTLIIAPIAKMMKGEEDEGKRERLGLIHRNAERLLMLVNQLLDVSKADSHQMTLNEQQGELVSFVSNICKTFRELETKPMHLSFHSNVESLIMAFDGDKMSKIITNLLSNAYKFTPEGGKVDVSLNVSKAASDSSDGQLSRVTISVADSGCGISDADKQHIFDRYYQAMNGRTKANGTGVGLNLVKAFTDLMHATLEVKDNPGGGTVFVLSFPSPSELSSPSPSELSSPSPSELSSPSPSKGGNVGMQKSPAQVSPTALAITVDQVQEALNDQQEALSSIQTSSPSGRLGGDIPLVLLVDDSADFRTFLTDILSEQYRVITAVDGIDAMKLIGRQKPDLILSDVMMPRMDGIELCKRVKALPEMNGIPFVMLTARLTEEQKMEGLSSGADEYITKPFNVDMLNLRLANLLGWHQRGVEGTAVAEQQAEEAREKINVVDKDFMQKVNAYIHEHLGDTTLTVEALSDAVAMSRVHLYKRVVSLTGSTPSEYIRAMRMKEAKTLLDQGYNVSEAAYKVGFNNPRYFSKYFNEAFGMTPSEYRKKQSSTARSNSPR